MFDHLIGQESVKRQLKFYIESFRQTSVMPFLLLESAKGSGKTAFARAVAGEMRDSNGIKRPLLEINCSVLKNVKHFVEGVFIPMINKNSVSIFLDETHALPYDLAQALLTICEVNTNPVREFSYDGSNLTFDFTKISIFFATTETHKIFPPLKDRLTSVQFEAYTVEELQKIVEKTCPNVVFVGGILAAIGRATRGNARSAVKIGEGINLYVSRTKQKTFSHGDWRNLCHVLNILPEGLTNSEVLLLKALKSRGALSLNMLASITGLSRNAIQRDLEQFLISKDMLRIDGQRKITVKGQKVLEEIDALRV